MLAYLIEKVGFPTETGVTLFTQRAISLMSIFNTGILIMLTSAYIKGTDDWFNGMYADFNKGWFESVGSVVVNSLILTSILPFITWFIHERIWWAKKALD